MDRIDAMLLVAECGSKSISTMRAGMLLRCSQQSASRVFRALEKEGLISKHSTPKGTSVGLTQSGQKLLASYRTRLARIADASKSLAGRAVSGSGEGMFYTELPGYKRQFKEKLNIDTFPGTLNISCDDAEIQAFLALKRPMHIEAFSDRRRTYGSLKAYLVTIAGIPAAAIRPERTHHRKDILELISNRSLRDALNLRDGSRVTLE